MKRLRVFSLRYEKIPPPPPSSLNGGRSMSVQKKLSAERARNIRIDGAKGLTRKPVQNLLLRLCTDFHERFHFDHRVCNIIGRAYDSRNTFNSQPCFPFVQQLAISTSRGRIRKLERTLNLDLFLGEAAGGGEGGGELRERKREREIRRRRSVMHFEVGNVRGRFERRPSKPQFTSTRYDRISLMHPNRKW